MRFWKRYLRTCFHCSSENNLDSFEPWHGVFCIVSSGGDFLHKLDDRVRHNQSPKKWFPHVIMRSYTTQFGLAKISPSPSLRSRGQIFRTNLLFRVHSSNHRESPHQRFSLGRANFFDRSQIPWLIWTEVTVTPVLATL